MEEKSPENAESTTESATEAKQFTDILRLLVGKVVTVVNPQSYEAAPVGYKLTEGIYRGKVTGVGADHLVMLTEFERKKGAAEPVKQFIPFDHIKRVSLMKSEQVIHL